MAGSSVRILYLRRRIILGQIPKVRKDGLSEYLCMYMLALVGSGSSVRILYPRESFDFWANPLDLSKYHMMLLMPAPC
jgi:hypothetical protein